MATLGPYLVSVGMIVLKGDRVLFVTKGGQYAGKWGRPSGFVEAGETVEEAAKRELLEETGIETELEGLLGVTNLIYRRRGVLCSEVHLLLLMSWKWGGTESGWR